MGDAARGEAGNRELFARDRPQAFAGGEEETAAIANAGQDLEQAVARTI
jgi:hypothetical protein